MSNNLKESLEKPLKFGVFYQKPPILRPNEWIEWEKKVFNKYPVQFFFREIIPSFFRVIYHRLDNLRYNLVCKFYYKYNTIKIRSLLPTYHDPDVILTEAVLQIFVDSVKAGDLLNSQDLDNKDKEKIKDVLNFIEVERPKLEKQIRDLLLEIMDHNKNNIFEIMDPDALTTNICVEIDKLQSQLYLKESEYLAKIVVYRGLLY